jgi:hypothetical protein
LRFIKKQSIPPSCFFARRAGRVLRFFAPVIRVAYHTLPAANLKSLTVATQLYGLAHAILNTLVGMECQTLPRLLYPASQHILIYAQIQGYPAYWSFFFFRKSYCFGLELLGVISPLNQDGLFVPVLRLLNFFSAWDNGF